MPKKSLCLADLEESLARTGTELASDREPSASRSEVDDGDSYSDCEDHDDIADFSVDEWFEELGECVSCLVELGPTLSRFMVHKAQETAAAEARHSSITDQMSVPAEVSRKPHRASNITMSFSDVEDYWTLRIAESRIGSMHNAHRDAVNPNFVKRHQEELEMRRSGALQENETASEEEVELAIWLANLAPLPTSHSGPNLEDFSSSETVNFSEGTHMPFPISGEDATPLAGDSKRTQPPNPGNAQLLKPVSKSGGSSKLWTPAEGSRLKQLRDMGASWSEIAKTFPARTEGSVRKHWYKVRVFSAPAAT